MKAFEFVQSLLPNFAKNAVLDDCRLCREEMEQFAIPAYKSANDLLGKNQWKHGEILEMQAAFDRRFGGNGKNMVFTINTKLKVVLENLEFIESQVEKHLGETIIGVTLTYRKTALLQFLECVNFVSRYCRKLLVFIYVMETSVYEGQVSEQIDSIKPAEYEYIREGFAHFISALASISDTPAKVKAAINEIPEVLVNAESQETLNKTVGIAKLDPLRMGFIPVWLNPAYHIGMFVAEWQSARYRAAVEEKKVLSLRRLNLERLSQGKPDAKLQKEIKVLESRLEDLNYRIAKAEKAAGM